MQKIASAVFRTTYAHLTEQAEVTVNGHVIGTWTPAPSPIDETPAPAATSAPKPAPKARSTRTGAQAERDEWLHKLGG